VEKLDKKYPFDKLVLFLILARNSYKSIGEYLRFLKMGDLNGKHLARYEAIVRKEATVKDAAFLDKKPTVIKRKADKVEESSEASGFIDIKAKLSSKIKGLAKRLGIEKSPYDNPNVKIILESRLVKRSLEVYLTSRIPVPEMPGLINDRFRTNFTEDDIEEYRQWAYDINSMLPDKIDAYFEGLPKEEKTYKKMGYLSKEDYVKWKMRNDCELSRREAIAQIMTDAYYNLQEVIRSEYRVSHSAAKVWADMFFKAEERLDKVEANGDKRSIDVLKSVRLIISAGEIEDDSIVSFEDLKKEEPSDGED